MAAQLLKIQEKHIQLIESWNVANEDKYVVCSTQWGECVTYTPEIEAYLQDAEPIGVSITNREIIGVIYDWERSKAIITIADEFFPTHEFDCTGDWTTQDCINAINSI